MHEHSPAWDGLQALVAKLGPGIAGSLLALKGLPSNSTFGDRLFAVIGGSAAAYYIAPGLAEWLGTSSPNSLSLMAFAVGAFGLVVVGEATRAIREVGLADVLRSWISRRG